MRCGVCACPSICCTLMYADAVRIRGTPASLSSSQVVSSDDSRPHAAHSSDSRCTSTSTFVLSTIINRTDADCSRWYKAPPSNRIVSRTNLYDRRLCAQTHSSTRLHRILDACSTRALSRSEESLIYLTFLDNNPPETTLSLSLSTAPSLVAFRVTLVHPQWDS